MVTTLGNADTYVAHTGDGPPCLPRWDGRQRAHRPWCTDCKRTLDADLLDVDGRCTPCAGAAVRRHERARLDAAEGRTRTAEVHEETAQRMAVDYRAGMNLRAVARKYHRSQTTTRAYLAHAGVTMRPGGRTPSTTKAAS